MGRKSVSILLALSVVVGAGFVLKRRLSTQPAPTDDVERFVFPKLALEDIDELRIRRNRWVDGAAQSETVVLKKVEGGTWKLIVPVVYPANNRLVQEILSALTALAPAPVEPLPGVDAAQLQLTDSLGIDVAVLDANDLKLHVVIGVSRDKATYLRPADRREAYVTPGLLRKVFDRSANDLRNRTISAFDAQRVSRVSFRNGDRTFTLEKVMEDGNAHYAPENLRIANFDTERAAKKVAALRDLHAADFYDHPYEQNGTARHVTVTLDADAAASEITYAFGDKDPKTGLHYLTTSASSQVFLVPPHLKSLFAAKPKDFERTDAEVAAQEEWRAKMEAHEAAHERRRRAALDGRAQGGVSSASNDDGAGADPHLQDDVQ